MSAYRSGVGDVHPPWADNPPPEMATAVDGKHPTGMHSSSCIFLLVVSGTQSMDFFGK